MMKIAHTKPPKLYKYFTFSEQNIESLKCQQLWFSNPKQFNDPYDCNIRVDRKPMTDGEYRELLDFWLSQDFLNKGAIPEWIYEPARKNQFIATCWYEGKPTERFKQSVTKNIPKIYDNRWEQTLKKGVTCFSEDCNNILMWAHYAINHTGFCLEFATSSALFDVAYPISYQNKIPVVRPLDILKYQVDPLWSMIITKGKCWEYEKEWRIFLPEGNRVYNYDKDSLLGVYFGINTSGDTKFRIMQIMKNSPTEFYQLGKDEDEFRLIPRKIETLRAI